MVHVGRRRRGAGGRLLARPGEPRGAIGPGLHRLELGEGRSALLAVPAGYRPDEPAPFILSLHGAGGDAAAGLYPLGDLVDDAGCILLAPGARGQTWDMILEGFGPDVALIDRALRLAFDRCAVDPRRLAVSGFSDGASYALSLGITNGDLFPSVLAFSPGFMAPGAIRGEPRFFVSHGTRDRVLPIAHTSREIVPMLERGGHDVRCVEFDGGHTVPPDIAREGVSWLLTGSGPPVASPHPPREGGD